MTGLTAIEIDFNYHKCLTYSFTCQGAVIPVPIEILRNWCLYLLKTNHINMQELKPASLLPVIWSILIIDKLCRGDTKVFLVGFLMFLSNWTPVYTSKPYVWASGALSIHHTSCFSLHVRWCPVPHYNNNNNNNRDYRHHNRDNNRRSNCLESRTSASRNRN